MNPQSNILERVMAPVIVNQPESGKSSAGDCISTLNNLGIQRLQHDVSETNRDVKQSEAEIRHDVLFEGQENQKTALEVEARLKDRLSIDRNAYDAQFMHLGEKICSTEKEVIKQGYEARLEALKTAERTNDKVAHALEEIREDLCECCKDQAVTSATQTGLLNLLVGALNVK